MKQSEEIRMTYSGVITKNNQKIVHVSFERGKDFAEGSLPSGKIEKSTGFTAEETQQLSLYLLQNADDIMKKAQKVNPLRNWGRTERVRSLFPAVFFQLLVRLISALRTDIPLAICISTAITALHLMLFLGQIRNTSRLRLFL